MLPQIPLTHTSMRPTKSELSYGFNLILPSVQSISSDFSTKHNATYYDIE